VLDDLLVRQRRTADLKARRELIHQIQRHLAKQQYYIHAPSPTYIAVWDSALKGYAPNLGYDYGGGWWGRDSRGARPRLTLWARSADPMRELRRTRMRKSPCPVII